MLFNLGPYEMVIIGVVFVVLVAWPVAALLVARHRQSGEKTRQSGEKTRQSGKERR